MVNLQNRTWPSSPLKGKDLDAEQLKQFLRIRADYEKSAFVTEGHFEVRALGAKEFVKPIPPDESAITALVSHFSGHVYGATSGRNAHLFFYNPAPDADAIADIGVVAPEAEIVKLVVLPDGRVIGAANPKGQASFLFAYKPCEVLLREKDFQGLGVREIFDMAAEDQLFFSTIDPCHSAGEISRLDVVLPEPVGDLILDQSATKLFLTGATSGTVFCYDLATQQLATLGRLDTNGYFSVRLVLAPDGTVYGAGLYGQLFACRPDGLEALMVKAPSLKGRELYNRVTAWTCDDKVGILYGGTVDGIIFQFFPAEKRIVCLGKPTDQTNIRAMCVSGGVVYALIGEKDQCCHLTAYEDATRDLRDLGCPLARSERPWNGYEFGSMVTGKDGVVFMGETDRISHLFMYFPSIR